MSLRSLCSLLLFGALAAGCSTSTQSPGGSSGETGSLSLTLELADGAEVNSVEWVITRGGMEPMSGIIDTSAPGSTASVEVFGLEPGDGYQIEMTAESADESTLCRGSAPFSVTAGEATGVMVMLKCEGPVRFGGVRANGKLNICAELTKMIVSPLQTTVGNEIDLSATGEDAEGDPITFAWTAEGGSIDDPTAAETVFTCEQAGQGSVKVSVSDDSFEYCESGWTVPVTCEDSATDSIATRPLSAMMAVSLTPGSEFADIPSYTKDMVDRYAKGEEIDGFPLAVPSRSDDFAGVLDGLQQNVVVRWFDAITPDLAPDAPRFGSNADYLAYFGDGWDSDWDGDVLGSGPMFNGSPDAAWVWSNHEYISNSEPLQTVAPTGQYLTLATFLSGNSLIPVVDPTDAAAWTQNVVDQHILWEKRQHGGSWLRVERQGDGTWRLVPSVDAIRYDSTDATLARITGYTLGEQDTDDSGVPLPENVVVGITADCSGGQTPWGTLITAEENAQSQWGDLEATYVSSRQFVLDNPDFSAGANISPEFAASEDSEFGRNSDPATTHNRDVYGFLVEIDPGEAPSKFYESANDGGDGTGHRKIGSMGRARWENVDTVTNTEQGLIPSQPVVMYGANDRRAGRVYKWVSEGSYMPGMTRAEVRALLDSGTVYVGHWADLDYLTGLTRYDATATGCSTDALLNGDDDGTAVTVRENCPALTEEEPGNGVWIELSVDNVAQTAPNAAANGAGTSVGAALQDVNWNGIGGFASDNDVLSALFTASQKLGVRELNRPEDVEWNPFDETLYVAFTYHGRTIGMKQDGTLIFRNTNGDPVDIDGNVLDPGEPDTERSIANLHTFERADNFGSIFAVKETGGDPATSTTFTFHPVFFGSQGESAFDTARPDNLSIDAVGGVWFGTDGNTSGSTNASADGIHFLDLNPLHKEGADGVVNPTYGRAFRILHTANDAEATGPAWNSSMDTIFYNAQHPGEFRDSAWPSSQPEIK